MKILTVFLVLLSATCMAESDVSVYYRGTLNTNLLLPDNARFDTLLRHEQIPASVYWRSAQITTPARQHEYEQKKQVLLRELDQLDGIWRAEGEPALATSARHILQQLAALQLTGRLPVVVDPDHVERASADNPPLAGRYLLFLAPRRPQVAMFGLMEALPELPLVPAAGIDEYWKRSALLAGAEPAHVWLIQPTGEVEEVPVAVWNKRHREPMAGAALLVGFDPSCLPASFQGINQRIAELIANRVPQ